jgi:hypothetical protein
VISQVAGIEPLRVSQAHRVQAGRKGCDSPRGLDSQRVVCGGFPTGHAECVLDAGLFHFHLNRLGHRASGPVKQRAVWCGGPGGRPG